MLNHRLAYQQGGSQINHYWILKNMLGNIVEYMLSNGPEARDIVLVLKAKMRETDTQLTSLDNTFAWNCMAGKAG